MLISSVKRKRTFPKECGAGMDKLILPDLPDVFTEGVHKTHSE